MSKKRKIDFILEENEMSKLIFRFYPRRSSCHSFGNEPPKSWSDVYKVYYSYAIIKQYKINPNDQWESEIMFYEYCDECSIIDEVGNICLILAKGYETYERDSGERIQLLDNNIRPIGRGTEWTISKRTCIEHGYEEDDIKHVYYDFTLFDYGDKGFRFTLSKKDIKSFGEYLIGCCEYMLAHGNPI